MRWSVAAVGVMLFCLTGIAMPAASEENNQDVMGVHQIEIDWHTAQTTKNLDLMMSVFADDATFTVAGKTFAGKAQIREFFAQNAVFKPQSEYVAYTPPSRFKYSLNGTTGHIYFECIQLDGTTNAIVPRSHVGVSADVARFDGHWVIKQAEGTPLPKL
jgi:hypothetical protein